MFRSCLNPDTRAEPDRFERNRAALALQAHPAIPPAPSADATEVRPGCALHLDRL